jgi:hypothetical protein
MARFRNVSGNRLEIPSIRKFVDDDGVFDVPDDRAAGFECQPANYKREDEKPAKAEKASK